MLTGLVAGLKFALKFALKWALRLFCRTLLIIFLQGSFVDVNMKPSSISMMSDAESLIDDFFMY